MAREALRDTAELLAQRNIPLMPLKGVLFQHVLYPDPAERLVSDVDVLVPEHCFGSAIETLLAGGFQPEKASRSLIEVALRSKHGLSIDLHRRLFSPGRYALSTRALFQRATRDSQLLGVPLHLADPHDTAAHLIGKIVSDHVSVELDRRLAELSKWCERFEIEPIRLSQHLVDCGLGRAARYTFELGIERTDTAGFFRAALDALPPDPVGQACVRVARALIPRLKADALAPLPAHLLNSTLIGAGVSASLVALQRVRHARWVRRRGEGAGVWEVFFRG